jgi:transcriptional regulator with XRE-family HTH domain
MSQDDLFINGDLLRLRREARGWVINDMATRACMSVKQIRQLEEGGISAFYSVAVKATAAKKVAALLGVSADEVFGHVAEPVEPLEVAESEDVPVVVHQTAEVDPVEPAEVEPASVAHASSAEPSSKTAASEPEQEKSKTSIWVIAALFAAALAVAAYMQPKDEPVAEAPPPLQVVPSEAADAASAAEAPASNASAADAVAAPASVPAVVASTPRAPALAASVAVVAAKPASASTTASSPSTPSSKAQ